tara:strand:+ start:3413 stop:10483 length:7071 start_codon:yes stop_codon:yes gene_type:complete
MAEIEKKLADYQESECKTTEAVQPIDERFCPTCIPNPSFKLEDKWHRIKKAYLDESVCEYRVRIYDLDGKRSLDEVMNIGIDKIIIKAKKVLNNEVRIALKRSTYISKSILPRNDFPTDRKQDASLGRAHLVAIPAFTVDQIPSIEDATGEQDTEINEDTLPNEFIVPFRDLNTRLIQLAGALRVYEVFYANANIIKENSVQIVEKNNPIKRFSYNATSNMVKKFRRELSSILQDNKLTQLYEILSVFERNVRKPKQLKFIFDEESEKPFKLLRIYAYVDGCEEYEELDIDSDSPLLGSSMQTVYYFMANLESVINDITAQETKPWLEFTLDNIYPEVVVDYGDAGAFTDDDYVEFGCLLENSFGVGKGQLANSIYKNALSVFKSLENQLYKEACRSINDTSTKSTTTISDQREKSNPSSPYDREKEKLLNLVAESLIRYLTNPPAPVANPSPDSSPSAPEEVIEEAEETVEINVLEGDTLYGLAEEYGNTIQELLDLNPQFDPDLLDDWTRGDSPGTNDVVGNDGRNPNWIFPDESVKIYLRYDSGPIEDDFDFEFAEGEFENITEKLGITSENVFEKMKEYEVEFLAINYKGSDYQIKDEASLEAILAQYIVDQEKVDDEAKSPHWNQIEEAWNEKFKDSNGILDLIKTGKDGTKFENGDFWINTINVIGLCGMSKLSGKVLKCLLGGATIDQLYDALIDKFFEFLEFNTLDLFLNNLPYAFRSELDKALQEQFGPNVSMTDLLNIKKQDNQKVRDVVNYGAVNQIFKIFEKDPTPLTSPLTSQLEKNLVQNNLGNGQFYADISAHFFLEYHYASENTGSTPYWQDVKKSYIKPSKIGSPIEDRAEYKPKKYAKKLIKYGRRSYLKGSDDFGQASEKLRKTVDLFGDRQRGDSKKLYEKKLNAHERTSKVLKESNLGSNTDVVFDVVFDFLVEFAIDSLSIDALIEEISKYPAGEWLIGFVTDFFKSCPHPSLFDPPVKDFMKSFSLDVCDPEISLTLPSLQVPNISLRYNIDNKFGEIFKNSILDFFTKIVVDLIKRFANLLEDALCKSLEAIGRFVENGIKDRNLISEALDNFQSALDEAFCGGSVNPQTGQQRSQELAESLFRPFMDSGQTQLEGFGNRISNIISGVASQREILECVTDGNADTEAAIANAISELEPEIGDALGQPDQISYFFENLSSYLSEEDKQRIRDLLEDGAGNLPTSASICLTSQQLNEWNNVRRAFFTNQGFSPEEIEQAIDSYNEETEEALESVIDDIAEINSEGPFLGALSNEALKDLCNPENVFNVNSKSSLDKAQSDELTEDYYNNILRLMMIGFFNPRSGILANALRDVNGSTEFKRTFFKFLNPNYANSTEDQILDFDSAGLIRRFIKGSLSEDADGDGYPDATGVYPITVGGYLRQRLLENKDSNAPFGYSISYEESEEGEFDYYNSLLSIEQMDRNDSFDYTISIDDLAGATGVDFFDLELDVEIPVTRQDKEYLTSLSFAYPASGDENLRYLVFKKILDKAIPLEGKNYENFYNQMFEGLLDKTIEASVTNKDLSDEIPLGFKFGYISEDIDPSVDFTYFNPDGEEEYNLDPEDGVLGIFKNDRIKVLNPDIYGGSYDNPPMTIELRKFFGWLEFAFKAFEAREGCDPKNPPILGMQDIKERVKFLESSLREYPELTTDPECRREIPFKLLVDSNVRANIDGVVRTTLRIYLAETFFKSIGVFSNIQFRRDNIDSSYMSYFAKMMKLDMLELGTSLISNRISIKNEKYWYTFLEQSVQVYNNMVELGEITPPPHIKKALEEISLGQVAYSKVTRNIRKGMANKIKQSKLLQLPTLENRPETIESRIDFGLLSILFRMSPLEDRDTFFTGDQRFINSYNAITSGKIRRASLKKLNFFQKIFFISMYEEECLLVLSELLAIEAERLSENAFEGMNDKPYIYDLNKSFVGLKSIFEDSNSNVGFNSYYLKKQFGTAEAGTVGQVSSNMSSFEKDYREEDQANEIQLVVESYARIEDRTGPDIPSFIRERDQSLVGVCSLGDLKSFFELHSEALKDKSISDYFGDLEFVFESSFQQLVASEIINATNLLDLEKYNDDLDFNQLQTNILNSSLGISYPDITVRYGATFYTPENGKPVGVHGETGINYGLRIGVLVPNNIYFSQEISELRQNEEFMEKSLREKAFLYGDDSMFIPLASSEVPLVDSTFSEIDPGSGKNQYDLECLINKIVETDEFKMLFNKVFPINTFVSSAAIFCSKNFMASLGRGVNERNVEQGPSFDTTDDEWDGTTNTFVKNFIRREFASLYLANSVDGFGEEPLSERERLRLFGSFNPFGPLSLPAIKIPWFKRRRIKYKVYDANGEECANPLKDLE